MMTPVKTEEDGNDVYYHFGGVTTLYITLRYKQIQTCKDDHGDLNLPRILTSIASFSAEIAFAAGTNKNLHFFESSHEKGNKFCPGLDPTCYNWESYQEIQFDIKKVYATAAWLVA